VIGVDIGGTFTDSVVWRGDGAIGTGKTFTTHAELGVGMLESVAEAAAALGATLEQALAGADLLLHGTTVGTNTIVERTGASVGLITTSGHADALRMARAAGRVKGLTTAEVLDVAGSSKPEPLVPRALIAEVQERSTAGGRTLIELRPESIAEAVDALRAAGCDALAISFLWSFLAPENERAAVAAIRACWPEAYVSASHEIAPRMGEYERTVATVINAYVGPGIRGYLAGLSGALAERGFAGGLLIMTCAGGVLSAEAAGDRAVLTIGSGPAAGVLGCVRLGRLREEPNVVATDMGGTTFDVAILERGEPLRRPTSIANRHEYFVETLDVQSIGAGGGSIAWIDPRTGGLLVGPRSAGSEPGPACYGRGGVEPTVTDADLVLGYLDPERFLGGRARLDVAAAEAALATVADPLGMSAVEVASGIVRIADEKMADLIRRVTVQRGFDPRAFTVYAYGGAGPVHVAGYGRSLGCRRAIVPLGRIAPVWSAFGAAAADVSHVRVRAQLLPEPFDDAAFKAVANELAADVERALAADGFTGAAAALELQAEVRYSAQIHSLDVSCAGLDLDAEGWGEALIGRFEREYERLFGAGTGYRAAGVEIAAVKVVGRGLRTLPRLPHHAVGTPAVRSRPVFWEELGGYADTPVHAFDGLAPDAPALAGPCVIELPTTSLVVRPGQSVALDELGDLVLELEPAAAPVADLVATAEASR
jgi:N-methylhydantoinase A